MVFYLPKYSIHLYTIQYSIVIRSWRLSWSPIVINCTIWIKAISTFFPYEFLPFQLRKDWKLFLIPNLRVQPKVLDIGDWNFCLEFKQATRAGAKPTIYHTKIIYPCTKVCSEIEAKWGNFGTHFRHFCSLASYLKVEIVIAPKLLQNGGPSFCRRWK